MQVTNAVQSFGTFGRPTLCNALGLHVPYGPAILKRLFPFLYLFYDCVSLWKSLKVIVLKSLSLLKWTWPTSKVLQMPNIFNRATLHWQRNVTNVGEGIKEWGRIITFFSQSLAEFLRCMFVCQARFVRFKWVSSSLGLHFLPAIGFYLLQDWLRLAFQVYTEVGFLGLSFKNTLRRPDVFLDEGI